MPILNLTRALPPQLARDGSVSTVKDHGVVQIPTSRLDQVRHRRHDGHVEPTAVTARRRFQTQCAADIVIPKRLFTVHLFEPKRIHEFKQRVLDVVDVVPIIPRRRVRFQVEFNRDLTPITECLDAFHQILLTLIYHRQSLRHAVRVRAEHLAKRRQVAAKFVELHLAQRQIQQTGGWIEKQRLRVRNPSWKHARHERYVVKRSLTERRLVQTLDEE